MSFRRGLPKILGKRISGYLVTHSKQKPEYQFYLELDDGTTYEIYSEEVICGAGDVEDGGLDQILEKYEDHQIDLTARINLHEEPYGRQRRLFKDDKDT